MNSSTMIPPFEDKRKVAHIQRLVNHPMTVQQVYSIEDEEKKGQISRHLRYMATWLKIVGFRSDAPPLVRYAVAESDRGILFLAKMSWYSIDIWLATQ